jgi:hypothetical protein
LPVFCALGERKAGQESEHRSRRWVAPERRSSARRRNSGGAIQRNGAPQEK